ncbi:MAG: hypothetical protein HN396_04545 [Gemmatimonadales bacterium]|jgi:hypothetical protein|nr:hypothetical protein [Gemmatimonadales bacterium]
MSDKNPYDIQFDGIRLCPVMSLHLDDGGNPVMGDDGHYLMEHKGEEELIGVFRCVVGEKLFTSQFTVSESEARVNLGLSLKAFDMRQKAEIPEALENLVLRKAEQAQEDLVFEIRRWEHEVASNVIEQQRETPDGE